MAQDPSKSDRGSRCGLEDPPGLRLMPLLGERLEGIAGKGGEVRPFSTGDSRRLRATMMLTLGPAQPSLIRQAGVDDLAQEHLREILRGRSANLLGLPMQSETPPFQTSYCAKRRGHGGTLKQSWAKRRDALFWLQS